MHRDMSGDLHKGQEGQGTIEYVLVMVAVAAVAVVLISWAKSGSGGGLLEGLFENVIGWVTKLGKGA